MIDFAAAWIVNTSDLRFKILLGQKIGLDALHVAQISTRLTEMLCEDFAVCPDLAYERNFDENTSLVTTEDIASFFSALIDDIIGDLLDYLDSGREIEDEPSRIILVHLYDSLHHQFLSFREWNVRPFTVAPIKIQKGHAVQSYDGEGAIPLIAQTPGRKLSLRYSEKPDVDDKSFSETARSTTSLRKFLHFIYLDVEIPTMEVCSKMMLDYRDMPLGFKLDLARQIWDEARHAVFMQRRMEELGCKEGDYAYSYPAWNIYSMGESLAEKLAMLQVVTEGNALDAGIFLARELRSIGDHETAEIFEYQNMDETVHAGIGNKWLLTLLDGSYEAYQKHVLAAAQRIGKRIPGPVPIELKARMFAGYPLQFLESLIDEGVKGTLIE